VRHQILALTLLGAIAAAGGKVWTQSPGVHPVSGRVFALPMGVAGADWLDRTEREQEEEPDRALRVLKIAKGATVADVGAGSGYMTERLSALVGPAGRVYATDIQPGMIALLRERIARRKLANVTPLLTMPDNPGLPDNMLDLVLMVDVYHELQQPQTVLRHIRRALKAEGRLVLLEYRGEDPSVPIRPEHKMTVAQARQELEHEGFALASVDRSLPRQHILIFGRGSSR
jgi:ubiquinone/menaquinone biosynthesis C-methylase UbiE